MSLYDVAVADGHQHERAAILLPVLGSPHIARLRDAWVEKSPDGPVIAVYTRQGGPYRECERDGQCAPGECLACCDAALAGHPLYLRDRDDDFDRTYATFYFRAPGQFAGVLARVAVESVDTDARWREAIARVERGDVRPAEVAMMDQLTAAIADDSGDSGDGPRVIRI